MYKSDTRLIVVYMYIVDSHIVIIMISYIASLFTIIRLVCIKVQTVNSRMTYQNMDWCVNLLCSPVMFSPARRPLTLAWS